MSNWDHLDILTLREEVERLTTSNSRLKATLRYIVLASADGVDADRLGSIANDAIVGNL